MYTICKTHIRQLHRNDADWKPVFRLRYFIVLRYVMTKLKM